MAWLFFLFQIFLFPATILLILALSIIWEYKILLPFLLIIFAQESNAGFLQPRWAELSKEAVVSYKNKKTGPTKRQTNATERLSLSRMLNKIL